MIGVLGGAMVASVVAYWWLNIMTKSQFIRLWIGTILLTVVTGAWTTIVDYPSPTTLVVLVPMFYYCWFFLSTMTANLIHMDPAGVIQFNQ